MSNHERLARVALSRLTEPGEPKIAALVAQLGAAMNAAGETVYSVQDRLTRVATAYGARSAAVTAFPTYLMVTMVPGKPATVELTAVAERLIRKFDHEPELKARIAAAIFELDAEVEAERSSTNPGRGRS